MKLLDVEKLDDVTRVAGDVGRDRMISPQMHPSVAGPHGQKGLDQPWPEKRQRRKDDRQSCMRG